MQKEHEQKSATSFQCPARIFFLFFYTEFEKRKRHDLRLRFSDVSSKRFSCVSFTSFLFFFSPHPAPIPLRLGRRP
jgi:hypothetical protein